MFAYLARDAVLVTFATDEALPRDFDHVSSSDYRVLSTKFSITKRLFTCQQILLIPLTKSHLPAIIAPIK